jgi:hypothetical protein
MLGRVEMRLVGVPPNGLWHRAGDSTCERVASNAARLADDSGLLCTTRVQEVGEDYALHT